MQLGRQRSGLGRLRVQISNKRPNAFECAGPFGFDQRLLITAVLLGLAVKISIADSNVKITTCASRYGASDRIALSRVSHNITV